MNTNILISENEAALRLGITKELLYSFVKIGYFGKKLPFKENFENKFFDKSELDDYNDYLKQPLSYSNGKPIKIPSAIREYLKVECSGKCARCGSGHRLDNAHIIPWRVSFCHHPHNIIRLCTDCHTKFDDGIITVEEVSRLKQRLVEKLRSEILSDMGLNEKVTLTPKPVSCFTGRKDELENLSKLILKNRIVTIEGVGGIGKTQLLLQYIKDHNLNVFWFSLENYTSLLDFKIDLCSRFQVKDLNDFVRTADKLEVILVFDGLESLWDLAKHELTKFLSTIFNHTDNLKCILTSQTDILNVDADCAKLQMNTGLSIRESYFTINSYVPGLEQDDNYIAQLVHFSDGHPLTVTIIAGLISFLNDPQKVINAIKQTGVSVLKNPKQESQNRRSSLEICLEVAYKCLNESQQNLIKLLQHFPIGCKTYLLAIENHKLETEINFDLAALKQHNLIYFEADIMGMERACMLNPIRFFLKGKNAESKAEAHKIKIKAFKLLAIEALMLHKLYMLSDQIEFGIARYEVELPNFLAAIKISIHSAYCIDCNKFSDRIEYLRIITGLAGGLYKFLFTRGHFEYGIFINENSAKAHVELNEFEAAIDDLGQVGFLNWRLYNVEKTKETVSRMLSLEQIIKKKFSVTKYLEGELLRESNPYEAIAKFEEAISICESDLGNGRDKVTAKGNIANITSEIGRTYERDLNNSNKALKYYLQGYEIQKEMKDYANMYCNSHHIGNCYADQMHYGKAIFYYKEALLGFVKFGQQQYIGNSLSELGRLRVEQPSLSFEFLTEDLFIAGLDDIAHEIEIILRQNNDSHYLNAGLQNEQIGKLWKIFQITSLSKFSYLLDDWCAELIEYFNVGFKQTYPWIFLKICQISCQLEKEKSNRLLLNELKGLCYLSGGEVEHDIFEPYRWLSLWLGEKDIEIISRGGLYAEIEEEFYGYKEDDD